MAIAKELRVLDALRANIEYEQERDGTLWGAVYLDNAKWAADWFVSAHEFAGYLASLHARDLYRPWGGADAYFGWVRLL